MINDTDTTSTACANCGKGEESNGDLKACTACKLVKYCNRDCQIAHRPLHKKACKKRAAELHDEELFKETDAYQVRADNSIHPKDRLIKFCELSCIMDLGG